jgi:TetR/AcrR family transcriptional regulator, regulator of cefoperazone and chloramphenicol sensitivity
LFRILYDRAVPVQRNGLTARARIREAALELFAESGADATSMRSVAARAGVSPSLVVHHFGTKSKLRSEVDHAVLDAFSASLSSVDLTGTPRQVSDNLNQAVATLIGGDRAVRSYLGRSLMEANDAGQRLFDALTDVIAEGLQTLEDRGLIRKGTDPTWRAYAILFIILGPIVLGHQLEARLGRDPFDPEVVDMRSKLNIDLLQQGLFTTPPS